MEESLSPLLAAFPSQHMHTHVHACAHTQSCTDAYTGTNVCALACPHTHVKESQSGSRISRSPFAEKGTLVTKATLLASILVWIGFLENVTTSLTSDWVYELTPPRFLFPNTHHLFPCWAVYNTVSCCLGSACPQPPWGRGLCLCPCLLCL